MKNFILVSCLFLSLFSYSQYDEWSFEPHMDQVQNQHRVVIMDSEGGVISVHYLMFFDTSIFQLNVDTFDLSIVPNYKFRGASNEYIRGDGSIVVFPSIPSNTNQLSNGAGFLVSSDISGKLNISDTASMLSPYLKLPSQTGNAGKTLTTNGSTVSWGKRQETYSGSTNASGEYTVTFGTAYSVAPNVQAQIIGGNSNQILTVTSVSTTGFTVKVVEKQTTTILGVVVLMNNTTNINGASVDVLITENN